ncbi:hypothetical protein [Ignicoccus hospitalis]|uniref:hypothetical protein n=1 Tax=Ignicoccus hospitalis TaxID=160233 RepID=UPI0003219A8C|nr:hypothetical protein [Ignicoccus hospitalis]HIH90164.1 hypothetical protein [Desulfurococcaceae archaeon]
MKIRDLVEEVKTNLDAFEEMLKELQQRREELKKEVRELMKRAKRLRLLERHCFKVGRSCSVEACYTGVRISRGVLSVDEDLVLYLIDGCKVDIVEPEAEDLYEALLRLKEVSSEAVKQLSELLDSL